MQRYVIGWLLMIGNHPDPLQVTATSISSATAPNLLCNRKESQKPQRAIEGIGAKRDGVIRHHAARKDGTVRDSVMYSILAAEWPDVRRHLELRLARHAGTD